jgi:predicted ATPase
MLPSQHRLKKQAAGFMIYPAKSVSMSGWRIEMLGGLRAVRGERTVERFPTRKTAALLAILALSPGRFHPREVLAEMLWPDSERESQLHNLRLALSRLRALFAPDELIEADRLSIRLDPAAFTTDVAEFEQAAAGGDFRAAAALYVGPLLPGLYEEWILLEQTRLEALNGTEQGKSAPATISGEGLPVPLPHPLTRFFGREAELIALRGMLAETRLITLTGPGGTGKTRLTLEAARTVSSVVFVPLADLTDPLQTPDAVRRALRLPPPTTGFLVVDLVHRELNSLSPLLLVLDNAEHLLKGRHLANFVAECLTAAPSLTILVASRRALEIPGEAVFPVSPLLMEARVALFLDRARAARPGFGEKQGSLSQTLIAVREICRRLEGIPLAIELAAARASVLSVQEILENVSRRLDFLASRPDSGAPRRHRSLRAALRSSFDLLSPDLQTQFAELSVFRGGFTAVAAKAVAGASLEALDELLRWSLLLSEEQPDGALRFRMLETLREFGQECLTDEELKALSRRQAHYFRDWAEANRVDDSTGPVPDQATRFARQDSEQDNIRAALTFCRRSKNLEDRESGLRIVTAFWAFWYARNAAGEMEEWVTGLLEPVSRPVASLVRARALLALGLAVRERGETARFAALVEEALAVLLGGPRDRHLALALHLRGLASADQRRFADSSNAYADALTLWEELGDRRNAAATRQNRALLAVEEGDLPLAEDLCKQALALFRDWNEQSWTATTLLTQAGILAGRGDFSGAAAACAESVAASQGIGYARGEAQAERDLCRALTALGRWDEGAEHAEHALALFRRVGDRHGEATTLLSLAGVFLGRGEPGDLSQAAEHFLDAKELQERYQWPPVVPLLEQIERQMQTVAQASSRSLSDG